MALTAEQIAQLLKQDAEKPKSGRRPNRGIDTSVRDYQTWHALNHKMFDADGPDESAVCSNPNCTDTRPGKKLVATVGDRDMCRICFLEGYGLSGTNGG